MTTETPLGTSIALGFYVKHTEAMDTLICFDPEGVSGEEDLVSAAERSLGTDLARIWTEHSSDIEEIYDAATEDAVRFLKRASSVLRDAFSGRERVKLSSSRPYVSRGYWRTSVTLMEKKGRGRPRARQEKISVYVSFITVSGILSVSLLVYAGKGMAEPLATSFASFCPRYADDADADLDQGSVVLRNVSLLEPPFDGPVRKVDLDAALRSVRDAILEMTDEQFEDAFRRMSPAFGTY